jgi:hypothetical protein
MNLSREYLYSDEVKQQLIALIERSQARLDREREHRERRRRRVHRLTFGLLGR